MAASKTPHPTTHAAPSHSDAGLATRRALLARDAQIARLREQAACTAPTCGHERRRNFTLRLSRPLDAAALAAALEDPEALAAARPLAIRGVAWLAPRHNEQALVSASAPPEAGSRVEAKVERGPPWWGALPDSEWPAGLAADLRELGLWRDDGYGDRQTELAVETPSCTARARVEAALRACELADAPWAAGPEVGAWADLRDPFYEAERKRPGAFAADFSKTGWRNVASGSASTFFAGEEKCEPCS